MSNKQVIIDRVDVSGCEKQGETIAGITCGNGERIRLANEIITKHKLCKYNPNCVYKQLKRKEQECEELKEKVKKYGEINEQETKDYAELKAENEELIRRITKIFACLIKANRTNKIVDTLWVDNITTLWDYIAQTLGIEGDQVQIEEQILQKISECEVKNAR